MCCTGLYTTAKCAGVYTTAKCVGVYTTAKCAGVYTTAKCAGVYSTVTAKSAQLQYINNNNNNNKGYVCNSVYGLLFIVSVNILNQFLI